MSFDIHVEKRLGDFHLRQYLTAGPGLTAILGPSGSGKTSLLNMVAGLIRPDKGHITVGDECLFDHAFGTNHAPEKRRCGYIFQDARLFPHLKVRANLLYGHKLTPAQHHWIRFEDTIDFLGISHLLDRWPETLSGGEKQRVAVGRALLSGPRFLLMDEPLSSLDQPRREEIIEVILHIRDQLGLPILYVTHDEREVERLATTRVVMDRS